MEHMIYLDIKHSHRFSCKKKNFCSLWFHLYESSVERFTYVIFLILSFSLSNFFFIFL